MKSFLLLLVRKADLWDMQSLLFLSIAGYEYVGGRAALRPIVCTLDACWETHVASE